MSQVFVSYSRTAGEKIAPLVTALQSLAVDVWWDGRLTFGERYIIATFTELRRSICVVVCFTAACAESGYLQSEAEFARVNDKLLPLVLEEGALFPPFNTHHSCLLEGFDFKSAHPNWQAFLARLGELLNRPGLATVWPAFISDDPAALAAWSRAWPDDPLAPQFAAAPPPAPPPAPKSKPKPRRVACVDDDTDLLAALSALLVHEGHTVMAFSSSGQAAQELASHPPDLLLIDLRMPDLDGFALTRHLRKQGVKAPVIVFTSTPHDPARVAELGVSAVVPKPLNAEILRQAIGGALEGRSPDLGQER